VLASQYCQPLVAGDGYDLQAHAALGRARHGANDGARVSDEHGRDLRQVARHQVQGQLQRGAIQQAPVVRAHDGRSRAERGRQRRRVCRSQRRAGDLK
jgi:hypothetical protein